MNRYGKTYRLNNIFIFFNACTHNNNQVYVGILYYCIY